MREKCSRGCSEDKGSDFTQRGGGGSWGVTELGTDRLSEYKKTFACNSTLITKRPLQPGVMAKE